MTAASTIAIVPIIVLFLILQRFFIDGLAGAVKG
jgi:raffinose/stachyose/melibiose transport system permease protein